MKLVPEVVGKLILELGSGMDLWEEQLPNGP